MNWGGLVERVLVAIGWRVANKTADAIVEAVEDRSTPVTGHAASDHRHSEAANAAAHRASRERFDGPTKGSR